MKIQNRLFANIQSAFELNPAELSLLYLVPLVQMAWVCEAVSPREKQVIYNAARADLIDERHELNDVIDDFLTYQPGQSFFDECLDLIARSLKEMTVRERNAVRSKILDGCEKVAASAGEKSLMDVNHHISEQESELLKKFREVLN
jgi:hypothetical protein